MESLIPAGRKFYGICLAGLGIQQWIYAAFLPVILPAWPSWIPAPALWAYLAGTILIVVGSAIVFDKHARAISLFTGGIFFTLFLFCHVPHLIFFNPYCNYLGTWTQAFKMLALSGGAFAVAGSYSVEASKENSSSIIKLLEKIIPAGAVFFSTTIVIFGIDHFLYPEVVATLVPSWIPGHLFWTYFAGVALISSGVAIILKIKLKLAAMLLGLMIFLWLIMLHIPRAIADPAGNMGNEVTSVFQALGFSGIAFVLAFGVKSNLKE